MTNTMSVTPEIAAWAAVVREILFHVPPEKRALVLKLAGVPETPIGSEVSSWPDPASIPPRPTYQKARVVYCFTRDICNSHRPADAARVLFQHHQGAPGSGDIVDYLTRLPGIAIEQEAPA